MSFSNVGAIVNLEPGNTVYWEYWFDGFSDRGLQIAGPHTGTFASPSALGTAIAFDQGKRVEGIGVCTYVVSIKNIDPRYSVRHNLEGGGAT
jgi:hypothetical protein